MSAQPELCRCGHLRTSHGVDDDGDRGPNEVCDEMGCPCERFRSFEDSASAPMAAVHRLKAEPDAAVIKMLEDMLAEAKDGRIVGLIALSFDAGTERRWHVGHYSRADALWGFEHMKHRLLFGEEK